MKSGTDAYTIKFWYQLPSTYWEQRTETVCADGKNRHKLVEKAFKFTHRRDSVKIISIIYQ